MMKGLSFTSIGREDFFQEKKPKMHQTKRKVVVSFLLVSGLLVTGIALADYVLQDGTKVKWAGGNQVTIEYKDKNGGTVRRTVNATKNADGRLVPNDWKNNSAKTSQTNKLGSQTAGGDNRFKAGRDTVTIPVYQNGKFVGYANNHHDANGLGRTYYTQNNANGQSGTAVISGRNGSSADYNWTQVDLTTPASTAPPSYNPPGNYRYEPSRTGYNPRTGYDPNTPYSPRYPSNLLKNTSIEHNSAWEQIRVKNQRGQAQFYAGEKFVVKATTTQDAKSVQVTFQFPQVTADISPAFRESPAQARPSLAATYLLTKQSATEWSGSFWRKPWVAIPDGTYKATITTAFQNGQTRTATHTLQIRNSILDFVDGIEKIDQ